MQRNQPRFPELALPVAALSALRRALAERVGDDEAAHALRAAGYAAGDVLAGILAAPQDGSALAQAAYFRRLTDLFAARGWGHLSHERAHAGVAVLQAGDWVESDPEFATGRPSCFFTTGMLANILGHAAGGEIAVYEAECRSRGDARCRFMIGAPETLQLLHETAARDASVEALVATLDGGG